MSERQPILRVDDLRVDFLMPGSGFLRPPVPLHVVNGVSFELFEGETLGLVGESGCGKTTLGRALLRLGNGRVSGKIEFDGQELSTLSNGEFRPLRSQMQMMFQDPFGSLNPRLTVGQMLSEVLLVHRVARGAEARRRIHELLDVVGLSREYYNRYPHEFSGGQRQRIGIARALALNPKLIVCDEPVSALDVSIQSQIINLLKDLQRDFALTYLFIAHDLSVVEYISDRVAVMYLGEIVEIAEADELYRNPAHPYTRALLSAVPSPEPGARKERILLHGDQPGPMQVPPGCGFHPRCPSARPECALRRPPLQPLAGRPLHLVSCLLYEEERSMNEEKA
ncbi:ABC transporter ATP-binding protein [Chlorobium phaeovibrioides]|uniref:ATP-binding cassette domain-containing protein n=2 Tax=Chlorobium phaeovibrioides TaxID=1094 RepID=A0A432AWZ2_CHLPH|nr:oligopeptide/dipeptide ABC transporter ATP-binding protein [Chlorobium phaeovibrioides]MWV53624.1 ATP-binding cassette domain-containing protein [Chlorobium phaeovibrioides]QEQ56563.1 ATP-binding cassette domain-containing protein [Chlorobium phaeovibrioides]RTY39170.1 ATP-binding cassette domain-containing protein [Chlorobium phaeovibrioides]HCD36070.1 ABC transporter ATP-binding protein [Chlorobium sp.]